MTHIPILPAANLSLPPLSGAPPGGDDPGMGLADAPAAQWDEAVARQADNDLLAGWNRLSDPFFAASGADALVAWPGVEQALAEHLTEVRAGLANDRQHGLFDPVAALRQEEWSARMLAHAGTAASDHNEMQSARRQALAVQGMADAAARGDADGVDTGLAVLRGEVRGRSVRGGLSEAQAAQADAAALAGAHAQVVARLAADDPLRGQEWLETHRATIGDAATLGRLDRLLAPFIATQCAERIADDIRAGTDAAANDGEALGGQLARIDALALSPDIADRAKARLRQLAQADAEATRARQDRAADRAWAIALDPASTSLRIIPPPVFAALAPDQQSAIQAALAANARRQDPPPDPALALALSDKAADGTLTLADVRTAWGHLPRKEWDQVAGWQRTPAEQGDTSDTAAQLRRVRHAVSAIVQQPSGTPDPATIEQRYRAQRAVLRDVAVYQRQNDGRAPDDRALGEIARSVGAELSFPAHGTGRSGELRSDSSVSARDMQSAIPFGGPLGLMQVSGTTSLPAIEAATAPSLEKRASAFSLSDETMAWLRNGAAAGTGETGAAEPQARPLLSDETRAALRVQARAEAGQLVTAEQIRVIMPNAGAAADRYVGPLNDAMAANDIVTPERQAAFFAQLAAESDDLNAVEEHLNYSAPRIAAVWPGLFPTIEAAMPYAHNPEALANRSYAGIIDNGNEASGDGYRYRGRGLIQLTGRGNYRAVGYENNPDALTEPAGQRKVLLGTGAASASTREHRQYSIDRNLTG